MIDILKKKIRVIRRLFERVQFYCSINWTKTLYFNFRKLPFKIAKKLPVIFYGKVHFQSIKGEVIINGPIKTGMIGFGQHFEIEEKSKGIAELALYGKLVFNGYTHFGKDVILYIGEMGHCEFGYMSCLASNVKLVCQNKIVIGDWTGVGYQSQLIDTNSHPMKNSKTGEYYPMTGEIILGTHNAFSNKISIMFNTKTPDYCVIASNTLCNKDYTSLGSNVLIGGVPAKLLKNDYTRDWENEKELLLKYKVINF